VEEADSPTADKHERDHAGESHFTRHQRHHDIDIIVEVVVVIVVVVVVVVVIAVVVVVARILTIAMTDVH
jgi:t-SNARE complex subunit (syntaxin)